MQRLQLFALATILLATVTASAVFASEKRAKPNFVFVISDDCTFRDIGCYGGQAHTPNIDKLATQGMLGKRRLP